MFPVVFITGFGVADGSKLIAFVVPLIVKALVDKITDADVVIKLKSLFEQAIFSILLSLLMTNNLEPQNLLLCLFYL